MVPLTPAAERARLSGPQAPALTPPPPATECLDWGPAGAARSRASPPPSVRTAPRLGAGVSPDQRPPARIVRLG